jgi:hypothetical protein
MQPKEENSSKKIIEGIDFIPVSSSVGEAGSVVPSKPVEQTRPTEPVGSIGPVVGQEEKNKQDKIQTSSNTNKISWSVICIILIILLLIFSVGYYYFIYMKKNKESQTLSEPLAYNPVSNVSTVPIAPEISGNK